MMKYDFDTLPNRKGSDSTKWNVKENELPMWIADMDFEVALPIQKAILDRASHPVYGYPDIPEEWYQAYIHFFHERHSFEIQKDWLIFSTGVVPTISSSVRKLTNPGDEVVLLTPVYNIFYNSILNNNRVVKEVPLRYFANSYSIDFPLLEEALSSEKAKLLILCNPQNPIGKIWSKEDLSEIGRLCEKHHVTVLSDEIHGEITKPGSSYIPFLSVNETNRKIGFAAISVTKAFNIAGIHTSAIIIPNEELRNKVNRQLNTDECAEPNIFAIPASIAALNDSCDWLEEMREYVEKNKEYVYQFIKENIPTLKAIEQDATYLMWLDISSLTNDDKEFASFLRKETGLYLTAGSVYGKGGEGFLRMNVATSLSNVKDACCRLLKGVESYSLLKERNN